jgi:hypothetical protein
MPPRKRRAAATATEETPAMTTTEESADLDTAPEDTETEETRQRRAAVRPEDAVFLSQFESAPPPKKVVARTYVRTPYDDVLDAMWQKYNDAGMPAWSLSNGLTKEDKPADGWWSDRDDIWMTTVVPDVEASESLVRRGAIHIGCSYRFKFLTGEDKKPVEEEDGGYRVWFTVAPVLKMKRD